TVAEALHASALLVDTDQLGTRRCFADRLREFGDLGTRSEIAGEQDHAGAGVVLQPVALLRGEFGAGNADHEHRGLQAWVTRDGGWLSRRIGLAAATRCIHADMMRTRGPARPLVPAHADTLHACYRACQRTYGCIANARL